MIGDPSGKGEERNLLSPEELEANRIGVANQIARILQIAPNDGGGRGEGVILVDNLEWLGTTGLLEFLRDVGKLFSVNEMIRKDSVRGRLDAREQSLSFTEFSYMLLQAWDFVQLFDRYGCELQLGGSDQWGNITEGIDLIRRLRGSDAFGLTSPLVTKADGTKFGKTEAGSVWLDAGRTSPYAFYQFWMQTVDAEVGSYLRRFTFLPRERIEELDADTEAHPERRAGQRRARLRGDGDGAWRGRGPPGGGGRGRPVHRGHRPARPGHPGERTGRCSDDSDRPARAGGGADGGGGFGPFGVGHVAPRCPSAALAGVGVAQRSPPER